MNDSLFACDTCEFSAGIVNWFGSPNRTFRPRYVNAYEQGENGIGRGKWQTIKDISTRLNKWGPKLTNFNLSNVNLYFPHFDRHFE